MSGGEPPSSVFGDPLFRRFFGDQFGRQFQVPQERRERSRGSGVIVSADGYVLTNNHVVAGANDIQVSLPDRREVKAKLVGTDQKTDVAVLKVEGASFPAMAVGDSSKSRIGDLVFAIGDPFGIGETVTMGIVSATSRGGLQIEDYEDFIQTDAAINPGNSGGALINARGELIGINTAILSGEGGGNQGIGFAIPVNLARQVMQQIVEHGKVVRGYLGVTIQELTPALAKAFGVPEGRGALVGSVAPGGPAAQAGLARGDAIVAMDGQPLRDSNDLRLRVAQAAPGTPIKLKVLRNGQERDVTVTAGELPESPTAEAPRQESGLALEGVEVEGLTPAIARQLKLPADTQGVVVTNVQQGTAAAEAGLRRGDVVQEVNRTPIRTPQDYASAIRAAGNEGILLLVNRGGATSYVVIEAR
jgi:serine protease Do